MNRRRSARLRAAAPVAGCCALALLAAAVGAGHGQSTLERAPNLSGPWTGDAGVLRFHLVHRFTSSGAPTRQVTSHPTFLVGYSGSRFLAGVHYATRSDVAAGVPNEWEPFARIALRPPASDRTLAAAVTLAWNFAARAPDADLTGSLHHGRLTALASGRLLGRSEGEPVTPVLGTGLVARLTQHVALAADVAVPTAGSSQRSAWGVGLQLAIPFSPHSMSLQATNTNSATVRGASRGGRVVRYGFEFTIPLTLRRYFGGSQRTAGSAVPASATAAGRYGAARDTAIVIRMHNLAYGVDSLVIAAGTTVTWQNADPLAHTVTADDGSWDSGDIEPGAAWRRRFDTPGTYPYHCTPHPFMRAVIVVR
jgi:plastocyanin